MNALFMLIYYTMLGVISQDAPDAPFRPVYAFFPRKMCKMLHFPLTEDRKRCMMILVQFVCVKWIGKRAFLHPHDCL